MLVSGMNMGICMALVAVMRDKTGHFAAHQPNIPETT